ncbi:MAG TPA: hypothetical protein VK049_03990 [Paenalcaligenes sp.]|nr:hypothetical protein [Paenalcaligenes sp.]
MPISQSCKRLMTLGATLGMGLLITACSMPVQEKQDATAQTAIPDECTAPAADAPAVGNWLNKRKEKGVTGELRTLFTLKADGSMLFTEQLKRPKQPSQGINESGCWHLDGDHIVLQTHKSNGMVVDIDDPIYTNRYRIVSVDEDELLLESEAGQQYATQRTSPGYRLPF